MRWPVDRNRWRRCFAFLPVVAGDEAVWLRWYWKRLWGDHFQVSFDPLPPPPQEQGER